MLINSGSRYRSSQCGIEIVGPRVGRGRRAASERGDDGQFGSVDAFVQKLNFKFGKPKMGTGKRASRRVRLSGFSSTT